MSLDLNSPTDFAKLTASSGAALASLFNGGQPSQWKIFEASYISNSTLNGDNPNNPLPGRRIAFHVFESAVNYNAGLDTVTDQVGRRVVERRYPYKDGQTTEDMGRSPSSYTLNAIIHGDNYLDAYSDLIQEFNQPTPGVLTHPIFGDVSVKFKEMTQTHKSDTRKAIALQIHFVEHTFDVVTQNSRIGDKAVQGKLTKLLDTFKNLDALATKVEATIFAARTVKNTVLGIIDDYQSFFANLASNNNVTFNPNPESYPALLPVNLGGNLNEDGTFASVTQASIRSVSDPFNSVPVSLVSDALTQALASEQITRDLQTLWDKGGNLIANLKAVGGGVGALEFYDDIQNIRQSLIDQQATLEAGIASSRARIVQYVTPRVMSIREVAFANGLSPDRAIEIDLLNPNLLSVNFIEKGTTVKVAIS